MREDLRIKQGIGLATGSAYCLILAISVSLSIDREANIYLRISWDLWED